MKINLTRVRPNAKLPSYATSGAVGCDLAACVDAPVTIEVGQIVKIPTGVAVEIPEGCAAFIYGRSGLGTRYGVTLANCVGVIDQDYRGELVVTLINLGGAAYTVNPFDRIGQLVLTPVIRAEFAECDALSETQRGGGGFGSTGK